MIKDISRWRTELQLAEKFRDEEFGIYTDKRRYKNGENIDYFEKGFSTGYTDRDEIDSTTTLNLFHVITKLIVPSLYFQNPKIKIVPKRKLDEDSAPVAEQIINYEYKEQGVDEENEMIVWDAYVLNRGVGKVGYATKFGMDIADPETQDKKPKSVVDRALESVGLKKKEKKEEVVRPEISQKIIAENPYVKWVSPFRFLMDPRARTIDDAQWVAEEFDKTVAELKRNKNYKNTGRLKGSGPDLPTETGIKIPDSNIEEFHTVRVYEVHYRHNNKYYRLVLAKDGEVFNELYHEESIYEMDGFQYDILEFNRHGHLQFKRSDLEKIKNIQDRITSTFDTILDQLDRFLPKVAYDSGAVTNDGVNALRDGDVGAIIECNKSPREAIQEVGMTQFKADLKAILDEFVEVITIMTGVTQSKLLGLSSARTATGEAVAQGGENVRLADMTKNVQRFTNKQARKFFQVIRQFLPLEELEIVTGESGIDPQTGKPLYTWLQEIDSDMSEKIAEGEYSFDVEVGSTQKIDAEMITKRIENLVSILARTDVLAIMQQQGKKVDLAEILRLWLLNNPEIVRDPSKVIQDVNEMTQGLLPAEDILLGGRGGITAGSDTNAARAQEASPVPTPQSIRAEAQ